MTRRALLVLGLAATLGVPNALIAHQESVIRSGTAMLFELAPVDPRSLMMGDYLRLDYKIARDRGWEVEWPRDGHLVVARDADGVAQFVRRREPWTPLAPGEHLVRCRIRDGRVRIGTDAFYFQEGQASIYEHARCGEVRAAASGTSVLVGLRDAQRMPLWPRDRPPPASLP